MPTPPGIENAIIEQFCVHQNKTTNNLPANLFKDSNHGVHRRISYTKEQKLAAISYVKTTWITQADDSLKLITKYCAAANLGITTAMLQD